MKILHLSFHEGCINDLKFVCDKLNIECHVLSQFKDLNSNKNIDTLEEPFAQHYNVTHQLADKYWNKYKNYFNSFDCIVTSDTAPLSRIFLQNNWTKRLVIWICNRFDYTNYPVRNGKFPDPAYYHLLNNAYKQQNVFIIGYTKFENIYANDIRKLSIGYNVITPSGGISKIYSDNFVEKSEYKNTIFVPPYHNDTQMIDVKNKLNELGYDAYCGKYNGPCDLCNYKCVVHMPYAWSNLALFEMFPLGIVYFIPSISFLKNLKVNRKFFWSPPYVEDLLPISEWYDDRYKDLLIYFNSWDDLVEKINALNFDEHKIKLKEFGKLHIENVCNSWNKIFH